MTANRAELVKIKKIIGLVLVAWTIFIGVALLLNMGDEKNVLKEIALDTARSYFRQLVIERQWNANHGGVYVMINEQNQPNPYLEDPLRDLTTDTGLKLTKINPAYMTRQIAEIAARSNGIQYHITSLKPIRPANKPTDWEARWLALFEEGVKEKGEFVDNISDNAFRYMAPLFVSKSCLPCHAKQGYRVGDIRGGISITLPQFLEIDIWHALPGFLATFAAGFMVILLAGWHIIKEHRRALAANAALRTEIDERKKTEVRAQKYLDVAGVMLCALNTEGEITLINQRGCKILHIDENDAIGKNWFDHFLPKPIVAGMKDVFNKLISGEVKSVEFYENEIVTTNGIKRFIAFHNTILHDDNGNIVGVLFSGEDITERKQNETERKKLEEQLRQAYKMEAIGTMAGGIAHDFNNILAIILGNLEIALEELPEKSVARPELMIIQKAAFRAKDLVSQILSFSRKSDFDARPIKPATIVTEIVKMLRSTTPTSIDIKEDIDPDCGGMIGDPTQIHQIVINLCTNAVQAMGEKGVLEISLHRTVLDRDDLPSDRTDLQPGPYIKLSISDTGTGIAADISDNIFDPFFTTKGTGEGTGMGLAVIHGIVMAHHGLINFESEPGKGTVFHVYFAMTEITDSAPEKHHDTLPTGNQRILLVDDEQMVSDMGGRMLVKLGYRVTTETSSSKALELFRSSPADFDLIITDYAMPDFTGVELATEILKIRSNIPVILCTGYTSQFSQEEVRAFGIHNFLMKPYDRQELATTVRKVLDDQKK